MYEKNKTYNFHIRLSEKVYNHIDKKSKKLNISKSQYVHGLLESIMINGGRDHANTKANINNKL